MSEPVPSSPSFLLLLLKIAQNKVIDPRAEARSRFFIFIYILISAVSGKLFVAVAS
jgi:hypothetical protein